MTIFCKSFTSRNNNDDSQLVRVKAVVYANEVNQQGDVISVSEIASSWGNSVTVWYKSMNRVEIDQ